MAVLVIAALTATRAIAIAPPYAPDSTLVASPVIVVAKWNGAPWKDNSLVQGNQLLEHEVQTEIAIERVIKGDLKPGKHRILVDRGIGWSKKRPWVMAYWSTQALGDASATEPNLWFLSRKKSRDKTDTHDYLFLGNYRGVQPLSLEPYFEALRAKQPDEAMVGLLRSDDDGVVLRALEYVSGQDPPWPYEPWRFVRPKRKQKSLVAAADEVRELIADGQDEFIRQFAAAVYADLAGKGSIGMMRELLSNEDAELRAIAIGTLAWHGDAASADEMPRAAVGIDDGRLGCLVVKRLANWQVDAAIPVLIKFLQEDGFSHSSGATLGIPAVKARSALKRITGCDFSYDVAASEKAWNEAKKIEDREQRRRHLALAVASDPDPWQAELVRKKKKVLLVVTNTSSRSRSLLRYPSQIGFRCERACFGAGTCQGEIDAKDDFVTLDPQASTRFKISVSRDMLQTFLTSDPSQRHVTLAYMRNGNEFGVNAWIGVVTARLGAGWPDAIRPLKSGEHESPKWRELGGRVLNGRRHRGAKCAAWLEVLESLDDEDRADATREMINLANTFPNRDVIVRVLCEALEDDLVEVRRDAASALGNLGSDAGAAVPELAEALRDEDWRVRENAAWALGNMSRAAEAAVRALGETLRDPKEQVRKEAAKSLDRIGPGAAGALPDLLHALEDASDSVRMEAARALWTINKHDAAVPCLIRSTKAEQAEARYGAVWALGRIGPEAKGAVPALLEALSDEHYNVRRCSAIALAHFPADKKVIVPALVAALKDKNEDVREAAVYALSEIDPEGAH